MKRVIVIGCPGSGKTTFAKKLHKNTDLPLYYLDAIWHKPINHTSQEKNLTKEYWKYLQPMSG